MSQLSLMEPTPTPAQLSTRKGRRAPKSPYLQRQVPDHPNARGGGCVREHVLVASRALGRAIPAGAEVHHVNGDGHDNRPCNLVICEDTAYHQLLHIRQRALDATGNADARQCAVCRQWSPPGDIRIYQGTAPPIHAACKRLYDRVHRHCRNSGSPRSPMVVTRRYLRAGAPAHWAREDVS